MVFHASCLSSLSTIIKGYPDHKVDLPRTYWVLSKSWNQLLSKIVDYLNLRDEFFNRDSRAMAGADAPRKLKDLWPLALSVEGAASCWVLTLPVLLVHFGIDDSDSQIEIREWVSQDPTLILPIANNFITNSRIIVVLLGVVQCQTVFSNSSCWRSAL